MGRGRIQRGAGRSRGWKKKNAEVMTGRKGDDDDGDNKNS